MIKYSNVAPIIQHKIARNKTMYEIYELSQEIIDIQIEIKIKRRNKKEVKKYLNSLLNLNLNKMHLKQYVIIKIKN